MHSDHPCEVGLEQQQHEAHIGRSAVRTLDCAGWGPSFARDLQLEVTPEREVWLERVREAGERLPPVVRLALQQIGMPGGPVAVHLQGLAAPRDLPDTPRSCVHPPPMPDAVGDFWLSILGQRLGWLFAQREICDGHLFHHIAPVPGEEEAPSGESSRAELRIHADGVSHPMPPDHVLLWCHRGDPTVGTCIADAADLVAAAGPIHEAILKQPVFRHRRDYEFGLDQDGETRPHPVISGPANAPVVSLDVDFIRTDKLAHKHAIDAIERSFAAVSSRVVLEPGDVLVIDNRRSLHGRDRFEPRYDGRDRWLQAAYTRRTLHPAPQGVVIRNRIVQLQTESGAVQARPAEEKRTA